MVQTFDTSRVGGGTYELELDSTGNYKLKSVGFEAVDKLNLPDLKTSDTSVADTTKKATEDTIKAQTTEVFKPMNTYGGGGESLAERQGFQDYDRVVPQTEKPNELNPYQSRPDITGMTFTGATGKETYKTPRTISDQNKYYGRTFTTPETGLQKVSSKIKTVVDNSMIANAAKALGGVFQGVVDRFVGPEQTALNNANKNALNSLGYKTNFELGNSLDPGRIAGNPVENVFAGMNAQSKYGDISSGADKRISTIENTISKMTPQTTSKIYITRKTRII
jgi:ethanolamine utilization microcompartment shell protein EutL